MDKNKFRLKVHNYFVDCVYKIILPLIFRTSHRFFLLPSKMGVTRGVVMGCQGIAEGGKEITTFMKKNSANFAKPCLARQVFLQGSDEMVV